MVEYKMVEYKAKLKNLAENLRLERVKKGYTKQEVAQKVGVTFVTIGSYELGSKVPTLLMVIALCDIYGVSIDAMLGDMGNSLASHVPGCYQDCAALCKGGNECIALTEMLCVTRGECSFYKKAEGPNV